MMGISQPIMAMSQCPTADEDSIGEYQIDGHQMAWNE
jgi:hypothetical protein